jgi:hypothetical protein
VDFSNLPDPSSRTMVLGWTQPLTEMSTRNLSGGKGGRCIRLTTLTPSVSRLSRESVGTSTSHKAMGLHGLVTHIALPFVIFYTFLDSRREDERPWTEW